MIGNMLFFYMLYFVLLLIIIDFIIFCDITFKSTLVHIIIYIRQELVFFLLIKLFLNNNDHYLIISF